MINNEDKSTGSQSSKNSGNCPYIGIRGEPVSFFGYANPSNCCFRIINPGNIQPSHQEKFCLTDSFPECEVYITSDLDSLPDGIRRDTGAKISWRSNPWIRFGVPAIFALAIVLIFLYLIFQRPLYGREVTSSIDTPQGSIPTEDISDAVPLSSPTSTPTIESEDFILGLFKEGTPSPTVSPTISPTPTSTPTITPTFTPEITPGPGFETPFGPNAAYLIHVVAEGENYPRIAQNYDTSIEMLHASNILPQGMGLRTGLIIVVLPGTHDPQGVPGFVTVLVDKPMMIEELAQLYQSSAAEIQKYNQINPDKPVPLGRWLIIPYP